MADYTIIVTIVVNPDIHTRMGFILSQVLSLVLLVLLFHLSGRQVERWLLRRREAVWAPFVVRQALGMGAWIVIAFVLAASGLLATEIIYGLAFQPVSGRLAGFLLDNLESSEDTSIEREMTLEEIASILATSSEVVCRLLYQFQSDGILKITRTHISFEDQTALEKLKALSRDNP